jgi:hypothetical protein
MNTYVNELAKEALDSQVNVLGKEKTEEAKREVDIMDKELEANKAARQEKIRKAQEESGDIESRKREKAKKLENLTREEKIKLAKKLKQKRMLKEMEAKKNGEN